MKNYSALLETELRSLPFSAACKRWFRDARVHTVEDTEEHILLLVQSRYYTKELLQEMVTVIRAYMQDDNGNAALQTEIQNRQEMIARNNGIIQRLVGLMKKRRRVKKGKKL